jgi:hypothetical protein
VIHRIADAAGITDLSAKIHGSRNPMNTVKLVMRLLHGGASPLGACLLAMRVSSSTDYDAQGWAMGLGTEASGKTKAWECAQQTKSLLRSGGEQWTGPRSRKDIWTSDGQISRCNATACSPYRDGSLDFLPCCDHNVRHQGCEMRHPVGVLQHI